MDSIVTAVRDLFAFVTGVKPQFRLHGGSDAENLALQNIQVNYKNYLPSLRYQVNRPGFGWFSHICSRNFCHGFVGGLVDYLFLAVRM